MATYLGSFHREHVGAIVFAVAVTVASGSIAGCAEQGAAEQSSGESPVLIAVHQTFITVENRAGLPLLDVQLAVVPYGRTEFTRSFSRMENGEKREVMMSDLSSRDGTVFSPRMVKARAVRLTGTDVVGKQYEIEVPWN